MLPSERVPCPGWKEDSMSTHQSPRPHPGEMRILTLNLWGRNGVWADRRSVLIEGFRALQAVLAARVIEERARQSSLHVVLGGDLDADPDATSIRFWSGRQSLGGMSVCYRDAWESMQPQEPGHTFTPENPLMALANWDW